jgi:hypothetical protein
MEMNLFKYKKLRSKEVIVGKKRPETGGGAKRRPAFGGRNPEGEDKAAKKNHHIDT